MSSRRAAPSRRSAILSRVLLTSTVLSSALLLVSPARAHEISRRERGAVVLLGIAVAALLTVPVLNIVVPVLAAASFTHLYQLVTRNEAAVRPPGG